MGSLDQQNLLRPITPPQGSPEAAELLTGDFPLRIINHYITRHLLTYLGMAILIASFVIVAGNLTKVLPMLKGDMSIGKVLLFVIYLLPQLMGYVIPMSLLIATLLLFNRMSAEHEVVALRASGLSIWQLVTWPLFLALVLSLFCFWLHFFAAPNLSHKTRWMLRAEAIQNPMLLIEEGSFIQLFDGYLIRIEKKNGQQLEGVHIYVLDPETHETRQDILAERGEISVDDVAKRLHLRLYDAVIITMDEEHPDDSTLAQRIVAEDIEYPFDYGQALNARNLVKRLSDMTLSELMATIRLNAEYNEDSTKCFLELHMRAAISLAPFSFILAAIPFGLQISRRETSAGLVAGILIALGYFGIILLLKSMDDVSAIRPHLLVWVPNVVCQAGGLYGLWKRR